MVGPHSLEIVLIIFFKMRSSIKYLKADTKTTNIKSIVFIDFSLGMPKLFFETLKSVINQLMVPQVRISHEYSKADTKTMVPILF